MSTDSAEDQDSWQMIFFFIFLVADFFSVVTQVKYQMDQSSYLLFLSSFSTGFETRSEYGYVPTLPCIDTAFSVG
jgi:hypothetical protein